MTQNGNVSQPLPNPSSYSASETLAECQYHVCCLWCDIVWLLPFTVIIVNLRASYFYFAISLLSSVSQDALYSAKYLTAKCNWCWNVPNKWSCWPIKQIHSPVHFVVRNYGNDGGDTDAVCEAIPEQWPTAEPPCLIKGKQIADKQNNARDSTALTLQRCVRVNQTYSGCVTVSECTMEAKSPHAAQIPNRL